MSVIKFLAIFILFSCQCRKDIGKVKISSNACQFEEIELKFEPVVDLSSILRNQKLSSLYFYQLKEQNKISSICYKEIINAVNK